MTGKAPKLLIDETSQGKPLIETPELIAFLRDNRKESNSAIVRFFKDGGQKISRKKVSDLKAKYCDVPKPETKKQKRDRHEREAIEQAFHAETKKERKRIIKKEAAKQARRQLTDWASDTIKGKDGQPLSFNGETIDGVDMSNIQLMQQMKESPQGNINFRAQYKAEEQERKRQAEMKERKAMLARVGKQREKHEREMRQSLTDKGLWTDMLTTMLDVWGKSWEMMAIAEWNWKHIGGETVETQVTAQAQKLDRPNQYLQAYKDATNTFNTADQKLRASAAAYFKLVNGENDEGNPENEKVAEQIAKYLAQDS